MKNCWLIFKQHSLGDWFIGLRPFMITEINRCCSSGPHFDALSLLPPTDKVGLLNLVTLSAINTSPPPTNASEYQPPSPHTRLNISINIWLEAKNICRSNNKKWGRIKCFIIYWRRRRTLQERQRNENSWMYEEKLEFSMTVKSTNTVLVWCKC